MNKQLQTLLLFLSSFIFFQNNSQAQCSGYSFVFDDITIAYFDNYGINFNYTIRNTGSTIVSTNNLIINTSLSTDEVVGGDQASGGSFIFGSVNIAPNETYTGSFQTSTINYPAYTFLRVNLEYAIIAVCQQSIINGFECLRPDAEISNFMIMSTQSNSISYHFDLKNIGGDTLFLNQLTLSNYYSTNNTYEVSDVSAGSGLVTISGKTYLLANESGTVSFTTSGAISGYNYLIAKLTYSEQAECLTTNNEEVVSIPVLGIFGPAATESDMILWNADSKSFTIQNPTGGSYQYQLVNATGAVEVSGDTQAGAATSLNAKGGFYVLVVSDGVKRYSKRIVY